MGYPGKELYVLANPLTVATLLYTPYASPSSGACRP